ncbi:DUF4920 domain-containing protein [Autumnicola musiva]|uniref:DUF4920 domain-containing protein n=1 Tax=Autumnicola musiva TaxID=3075589 RepID=A0ABU3D9E4_9FLAO|nr:DUF4920 domain-containing protein [Zunongwangia sp. F117]MDT0678157.1 DUF4920 domain-containing protein [Zunongwangia sp. F117]
MKKTIFTLSLFLLLLSCNDSKEEKVSQNSKEPISYEAFGNKIQSEKILTSAQMQEEFKKMEVGDSLQVSMETNIMSVCKKKGCWMTLQMPGGEEVMVKFKDYAFFMPKDIENKEVIVEGIAYIKEVSLAELKHFAEDAGNSEAEIAAINQPEQKWSFLAEGVLLKN